MKKDLPRIGIDHDDTVVELYHTAVQYLNKVFNTSHTADRVTTYWLEDLWGCSSEEMMGHFNDFIRSEEYQDISFIPGAQEALNELRDHTELILITNRWESLREPTIAALNKHLPNTFSEHHFLGTGRIGKEAHTSKGELARKLGLAAFVEDSLDNARGVSFGDIPVILLDRPWNQGDTPKNVHRVSHWDDALNKLRHILDL